MAVQLFVSWDSGQCTLLEAKGFYSYRMKLNTLTRRDFLKLSGMGMAGLFMPPLNFHVAGDFLLQQGRVTSRIAWMYDQPSVRATQIKICHRDTLLNIANTAISDDVDSHNRVWYEIGTESSTEGYVYSGNIQPVKTLLNKPTPHLNIPAEGLLTEVSVPYTDAYEKPDKTSKVAYRMYYETTHWVRSMVTSADGQNWYAVRDDKYDMLYYAPAEHIRIMTAEELAPLSAEVSNRNKRIEVQLERQLVIAYEKNIPVFMSPVSTGGIFRAGTYSTPKGAFVTYY